MLNIGYDKAEQGIRQLPVDYNRVSKKTVYDIILKPVG